MHERNGDRDPIRGGGLGGDRRRCWSGPVFSPTLILAPARLQWIATGRAPDDRPLSLMSAL